MSGTSKYSDEQVNAIQNEIIAILHKHNAPVDLSLSVLGNMVSNLLLSNLEGKQQRAALAQAFANALLNSVK